jgi:hypothetical protein
MGPNSIHHGPAAVPTEDASTDSVALQGDGRNRQVTTHIGDSVQVRHQRLQRAQVAAKTGDRHCQEDCPAVVTGQHHGCLRILAGFLHRVVGHELGVVLLGQEVAHIVGWDFRRDFALRTIHVERRDVARSGEVNWQRA